MKSKSKMTVNFGNATETRTKIKPKMTIALPPTILVRFQHKNQLFSKTLNYLFGHNSKSHFMVKL